MVDSLTIFREPPDTRRFADFDGEPMVQSFRIGDLGRAWITTAEALSVPGFGRQWVAAQLSALDRDELERGLALGLRLRAQTPAAALVG